MAFGGGFQSQPRQQQDITNTLVQTVKQDVDLCEKGKQWTFSCYSPAKETASVPGIEDVSPEEMRLDAYQARMSGKVDDFQRRYQQLVSEYAVKWKAMLNPNEALKDVLRKIYNRENLVGVNPATLFQQGGSGGGIFGGGTTTSAFQSGGSIFGGGQAAPPAAATATATSSGIFGGKPVFGSPLFGGAASTPSAPATAAPGSSIFGGGVGPASGSSVFGGRPAAAAAAGGIFSSQAAQPQQPSSLFGGGGGGSGGQSTSSVFGQPAGSSTSSSIFGGPPAFGSTPGQGAFGQAASSGSIFGQAPQQFGQSQRPQSSLLQQNASPLQSSIFGQASSSSPSRAQPTFSSLATGGSQQSVFGSPATAAPAASPPCPANSGELGAPARTAAPLLPVQPSPPGGSIFGSATPQAAAAQSIFGSPSAPTAPSPFSPVAPSATSPAAAGATVFGAPAAAASNSAPGGSVFGAPISSVAAGSGTAGLFGKVIKPQIDPSRFTPLEELTPEELAEFTAEHFTLGKIPERPPPKQFCVVAA